MNTITKDNLDFNDNIRRKMHCGETYYSVIDFIAYITDSKIPKVYWKNLKGTHYILQSKIKQLKLISQDNKYRLTDCAQYEILDYIMCFIPEKKLKLLN